jgi:hypothetical protein
MTRYYLHFPGNPYALGPVSADSKAAARAWARQWAGLSRLPRGFALWEA